GSAIEDRGRSHYGEWPDLPMNVALADRARRVCDDEVIVYRCGIILLVEQTKGLLPSARERKGSADVQRMRECIRSRVEARVDALLALLRNGLCIVRSFYDFEGRIDSTGCAEVNVMGEANASSHVSSRG